MAEDPDKQKKKEESRKSTIKDVIEIVIFLGIAVLLVFSFNWILSAALKTDIPLVVVTSESMEPIYYGSNRPDHGGLNDIRKDMLVVKGVDPSEIKIGDTIVFYRVNASNTSQIDYVDEPIVHRVNAIYYNSTEDVYWFTTKGDNPDSNDNFITTPSIGELTIHENRVIGKIVARIPYLGGLVSYFRTTVGRTILIVGVGLILILTFIFGSTDKDKDEDVFDEKTEQPDEPKKEVESEITVRERFKNFYNKMMKHKHIVFPSIVLVIIVFIPIIDTLSANWGTSYGIVDASSKGYTEYSLVDGNKYFVFVDVTINCPGHWHQKFRSFTLQIFNQTTGELLGETNWTAVYNFEGSKTVNSGAWIDPSKVVVGLDYNLTVTANLQSKFGKTMTDVFSVIFTLNAK
jgi:signal peptidase I